jgi:FHS family L-fucose permease-like MFS transporter
MSNTTTTVQNEKSNMYIPIAIIAGLFAIFGFVTWINGALIPYMGTINELTDAQAYFVATASYISFVVMALPASFIIKKAGYRNGMSIGLIVMAVGAFLFIPVAANRIYWASLICIFIQGAGMTIVQTAANPYITILGPIESAAKRISIMGIANKSVGALGSLIFGAILLSGIDEVNEKLGSVSDDEKNILLDSMADNVIIPYLIMAAVLFGFGLLIRRAPLPHVEAEPIDEAKDGIAVKTNIFQFPHLWLGVFALFLYVGAEVVAGDTIIKYGLSLGISVEDAKFFTSFTLMAMVGTYALGVILIPKYLKQDLALKISAVLGLVFTTCVIFTTGYTSVMFVAALGIANALVWPAIWPLTLEGLGKFTKTASALLIMAISGGAIIPPLYGQFVDVKKAELISQGINEATALSEASTSSYLILFPCYIFILYYAISGHKLGLKKS